MKLGRIVTVLAALSAIAGCGSRSELPGNRISGSTLTLYSSAPLHGASSANAAAALAGEKLALAQIGGRIGKFHILLRSLDDSGVARGQWDPGQTTLNARTATLDPTTIGYLGEFNSGASAISIPLLNRAGIPQISPGSGAVGLTADVAGASPGEPEKYYPTGVRTFARVVPTDAVQGAAQVKLARALGCRSSFVLDDGGVDGLDMATSFSLAAQAGGIQVIGVQAFDPHATDYSSLALATAQTGAACVLISAIAEPAAALLARAVAAAMPRAPILAGAPLAESTFADPARNGLPRAIDARVLLTCPTPGPGSFPPAGRAFLAAYTSAYGGHPEPYAIYGYEAMSLMLNAIGRATAEGRRPALRSKVLAAIFSTRDRHSVLGTYSIDHNGDTNVRRYSVYRVLDGQMSFVETIDA